MRSEEDFGFSLVDDDFVPPGAEEVLKKTAEAATTAEQKLVDVMDLIMPLVNNLCKDPTKTTMYWPNRVEKMEAFKAKLLQAAGMDE
jgi:hypothetical protein